MNFPSVDIFNNSPIILNRKSSKAIQAWLLFLIIGLIIFLIISNFYTFHLQTKNLAYIKPIDSKYYLITYVEEQQISKLYYYSLFIEEEKYDFKVINISEEMFIINNKKCHEVTLDLKLKEEWLIENNVLNIVLKKEETTILKEIKKGIQSWKN